MPLVEVGAVRTAAASQFHSRRPVGEDATTLLSWRYLPIVRGDEIGQEVKHFDQSIAELKERGYAWVKYDQRERQLVIGRYDEDDRTLVSCHGSTLHLIARGDIDGDGLEDIVAFWAQGSLDWDRLGQPASDTCGTVSIGTPQVLTRRSSTSRYEQICPQANDPDQAEIAELWVRFNGPCPR